MKTPLKVSLFTVAMNAVLNILAVLLLPVEWRHVGLAGSTVFCSAVGCLMLVVLARRRNGALGFSKVAVPMVKIFSASAVMCAVIYLSRAFIVSDGGLLPVKLNGVLQLTVLIALGAAAYFAASLLFMRKELKNFRIRRRRA